MTSLFGGKKEPEEPKDSQPNIAEDPLTSAESDSEETVHKSAGGVSNAEREKLLKEVADYKDKYVRIMAEFENVRKRSERERAEFVKYANEGLLSDFVNVLDDLERSVAAAQAKHEDYSAFLKGIELVMAQLYEMLKRNNVRPVESVGKKFDHTCHEALMQEEVENGEDGKILEEFQKGYFYGDRVLRTAKVKVAKKKE